ncbi:MAG TPA: hypothetical protein VKE70_31915 [Candidatus Solibacter sp.]|nr:hypothetical protein [Candidatus Solibacter sp.]
MNAGLEITSRPYIPAFRNDHTYRFIVDTALLPGGNLPVSSMSLVASNALAHRDAS